VWTKESLQELIRDRLQDHPLVVVANREPYIHRFAGDQVECIRPASGMASALDPILQACGGVWVAHGGGDADRATVDENDHVAVPPDDPRYTLRRIWLTKEQEDGYYYGLANEGLWPLCHVAFTRPNFNPRDWRVYREVNQLFAEAVLEEAKGQPAFVFIQDYHFALLPRLLKQENPNLIVAQFWHIPWPNREIFRAFPWKEELLDGLLGNDLLGFHIRYHCQNFLDTVDRSIEAMVDMDSFEVTRNGRTTTVRPFPISIDFERHDAMARSEAVAARMKHWQRRLGIKQHFVGVGIERLDYTKGVPDRLRAVDYLLESNPEYRGRLLFVQVAVPSRSHIPEYKRLANEIDALVEQINWKWRRGSWHPIVYIEDHQGPVDMMALHRLADFCVVSSLHDGMNLVAKEYVASCVDDNGALVLSQFTGSSRELTDDFLVTVEEMADAIHRALTMPADERRRRMQKMRAAVAGNDVYRWAGKFLSALLKFEFPENGARQLEFAM
jgi:trehalose 6-phosphate synthase